MSRLPADVVTEILLKLPAKSLLRFKSVCKLWHELINDSVFMNRHVEQSNKHLILRTFVDDVYMCDFDTPHNPRNLNFPSKNWRNKGLHMVGSGRGLLCFSALVVPSTTFLYNPTTRTYKTLPSLPKSHTLFDRKKARPYKHLVFGYDHLSQDYKCFSIVSCRDNDGFKPSIMVYSLRHDTWKPSATDAPCSFNGHFITHFSHFVFFNGVVHWAIEIRHATYQHIVGIDLSKEALSFVPLPNKFALDFNICIRPGVLDSCLCLIHKHSSLHHDIWIMKEYGVATSWTLMCRVGHRSKLLDLRPISFFKSTKDLLLVQSDDGRVITWDLKTQEITIVHPPGFHKITDSFVCLENLLVLKGGIEHLPRERNQQRKFRQSLRKTGRLN